LELFHLPKILHSAFYILHLEVPSGLLGPVRVLTVIEQPIEFQPTEREVSQRSDNSATQ